MKKVHFYSSCFFALLQQVIINATADAQILNPQIEIIGDTLSCEDVSTALQLRFTDNGGNYSFKWYNSGIEIQGETGSSLVVTRTGAYSGEVITEDSMFLSPSVFIKKTEYPVLYPKVGQGACDAGDNVIEVFGDASVRWYDAFTNGVLLDSGRSVSIPIFTDTTFYAQGTTLIKLGRVGPENNAFDFGDFHEGGRYNVFNAETDIVIKSATTYAEGRGRRTIYLRDAQGQVLDSATAGLSTGENRVELNFIVPQGDGYQIGAPVGSNLYRSTSATFFPYDLEGLMSITHVTADDSLEFYYYLYDIEVESYDEMCTANPIAVPVKMFAVPEAPEVFDQQICDTTGIANMEVLNPTTLTEAYWYDQSGALFFTGNSFDTLVDGLASFEVEQVLNFGEPLSVGAEDTTIGTGDIHTGGFYLIFDVFQPCTLNSVLVYSDTAKERTVQLFDSDGNILLEKSVMIGVGEQRVDLDLALQPGQNYQIGVPSGSDLYRTDSGPAYPYRIDDVVSIKSSSVENNPLSFYYYFYDWEIQVVDQQCRSERIAVEAEIEPCTGIEEGYEYKGLKVFPNPLTERALFIENAESEMVYELVDLAGNIIDSGQYLEKIELEEALPGVYFLKVVAGEQILSTKIIIP